LDLAAFGFGLENVQTMFCEQYDDYCMRNNILNFAIAIDVESFRNSLGGRLRLFTPVVALRVVQGCGTPRKKLL
jgi:hypothetical protein